MTPAESTTDCLMCKTERGEFQESKSLCLRCQQSRIEHPGHTDIEHPDEPPTFSTPGAVLGQLQPSTHQGTPLAGSEELDHELVTSEAMYSTPGTSEIAKAGAPSESTDILNQPASFSETLRHSSADSSTSNQLALDTTNTDPAPTPPRTSTGIPLTSGLASPLGNSSGIDQPPEPLQHVARPTTSSGLPSISSWPPPNTEEQDDVTTLGDENPESVVSVIHRQLVLDKTAESNALPFVLQGYASWVSRVALDPLKVTGATREFVCSQFGDGDQSRWVIALLANIGSRIGSVEFVEATPTRMLSLLQTAVRRRLRDVKSRPNPSKHELVRVLESATEATVIQFYASPVSEAMTLLQETMPIFRRLCPGPPDAPIDLHSLLQHPSSSLWRYAEMDITTGVLSDMPTKFQYQVALPGSQLSNFYRSVTAAIHDDGLVQWMRGIPNRILIILAYMKSMHQNGQTPDEEMVTSIERDIREVPLFSGSASDRFLVIMRSIVQECWRQAAFVYLYMAVCGDSSDTPRVKEACKHYMRLLKGIKPGRLPDEYLLLTLQLVAPAAQRPRDREVIKQRALALRSRDRTHGGTTFVILVMEGVWAWADAEGRPILWSDKAVSRRQVIAMLLPKQYK